MFISYTMYCSINYISWYIIAKVLIYPIYLDAQYRAQPLKCLLLISIFFIAGEIQKYFGETIAMYFAFLGFYTMALIPPAVIGSICTFYGRDNVNTQIFFSMFNLVWATVFLEAWKQNCATLAYKWGTINSQQFEEARAEYSGELKKNEVTDRLEPHYPPSQRMVKFYCVSVPLVLLCLFFAFLVMLFYFWLQELADVFYTKHENMLGLVVGLLPSMTYAIIISIMNAFYRKMAVALNDWGKF